MISEQMDTTEQFKAVQVVTQRIDIVQRWIDDLATNPPQTHGCLHDSKGHCCIGRLYEVLHGPDAWTSLSSGLYQTQEFATGGLSIRDAARVGVYSLVLVTRPSCRTHPITWEKFFTLHNDARYSFAFIRRLIITYLLIPLERELQSLLGHESR